MNISILCGHFMPEIGYLEVSLAKTFSRLGHSVVVITSNKISPSSRKILPKDYPAGTSVDPKYRYKIIRLTPVLSLSSNIVCNGLNRIVQNSNPDLVLIVGVGKVFPLFFLLKKHKFKSILFLGNNIDMQTWQKKSSIVKKLRYTFTQYILKRPLYHLGIRRAEKVVLYTPSTKIILKKLVSKEAFASLEQKYINSTLGFDAEIFYFSNDERAAKRDELGLSKSDTVLFTSTRITPRKRIERFIYAVDKLNEQGIDLKYIIIGFLNDDYEQKIKSLINNLRFPSNFILLPFQKANDLRQYCCAADIGVWNYAAISIQEAMGTGLQILLEDKDSINQLITPNKNGQLYSAGGFENAFTKMVTENQKLSDIQKKEQRKLIEQFNYEFFSYDEICNNILHEYENH